MLAASCPWQTVGMYTAECGMSCGRGHFEAVSDTHLAFFQLLAVLGQMYQIGSAVFLVRYAHDEMLTLHIPKSLKD